MEWTAGIGGSVGSGLGHISTKNIFTLLISRNVRPHLAYFAVTVPSPGRRKQPRPRSGRTRGGLQKPAERRQTLLLQKARWDQSNGFDLFPDIQPVTTERGSGSLHR